MNVRLATTRSVVGCALLFLALAPGSAAAQWQTDTERAMRATATLVPPAAPAVAPAWAITSSATAARRAPGTALMIIGGAAVVLGLVADEGLLVVGGFVVAAYGVYLYLR